ncbi:glutathione S-transferase family protein [Phyllobacterium salinisoli]|uniref:Glutathione S-transferase family protein n=1 Tax=Phyllobacterium salinisoli TaxID=1899321 RepID=A0A368JY45_9HYPH|nr:glutathione S-transferase family protein [Phyllobacterium salinisoli]RCS21824.1 glutathione S-transferase family protein [Phyllobacterium salinisoli]
MKLLSGPLSLFSRKVEISLHEKGLTFERVMVPFSQTEGYNPKHPDVLATNPMRQVPVLLDGDIAIYDSTVIIEYLEDAFPQVRLLPGTPVERVHCRLYDLFADEILLVSLKPLMHRTTPGQRDSEYWSALERKARPAETALDRHFADLSGKLEGRDFLCGSFSAADIAVFMAILFALRLGGASLDDHPALADWYRRLLERPAFGSVACEIAAADRQLSAPVKGAYGDGRWLP